jgi:hypothetical protein
MLTFHLEAPGVAAPGLDGWAAARSVLLGHRRYLPGPVPDYAPEILPPTARRRGSRSTRLAVQAAQESLASSACSAHEMAAVFASSTGDPEITDRLCRALAEPEPVVSPTSFHNSVHNAPAGYWSIATGSQQSTSSLAAYEASFAAGLVSAAVQVCTEGGPVILVAYDLPYPEPLHRFRTLTVPFATALILTSQKTDRSLLQCRLVVTDAAVSPSSVRIPELEALRREIPAARALPILAQLADPAPGRMALEYLTDIGLVLDCTPC